MEKNFLDRARSAIERNDECDALACYIAEAIVGDPVGWTLAARLLEKRARSDGSEDVAKIFRLHYFNLLESRAMSGDLAACRDLVGLYEFGQPGFQAAPEKAVNLLRKMAEQGDVGAQFELFEKYLYGLCDLPQDKEQARKWLQIAAFNGHAEAKEWIDRFKEWDASGFVYPRPIKGP